MDIYTGHLKSSDLFVTFLQWAPSTRPMTREMAHAGLILRLRLFSILFSAVSEEGKDQTCSLNFVSWQLTPRITPNNYNHNTAEKVRVTENVAKLWTLTNRPRKWCQAECHAPDDMLGIDSQKMWGRRRFIMLKKNLTAWGMTLFWKSETGEITHEKNSLRVKPAVLKHPCICLFLYFFLRRERFLKRNNLPLLFSPRVHGGMALGVC